MTVAVLNWNSWSDTIACAESVLQLAHQSLSVIVCDNNSADDSIEQLQRWGQTIVTEFPRFAFVDRSADDLTVAPPSQDLRETVVLVQSGRNGGYAAGNNICVRAAMTDRSVSAVWILNNDIVVHPNALTEAVGVLLSDERIGLVGSTLRYMDRPDVIQCQGGGRFFPRKGLADTIGSGRAVSDPLAASEVIRQMQFVNGAAVLASRRLLEEVGLMAEDYFLYWEELDWATRARPTFTLSYAPEAIVYHKVGATLGTKDGGEGSELSEYYYNRNRVRFCQRHYRRSLPYVYSQLCWEILQALAGRRPRRARLLTRAILGLPGPKPEEPGSTHAA